jgi:hypothetical protein
MCTILAVVGGVVLLVVRNVFNSIVDRPAGCRFFQLMLANLFVIAVNCWNGRRLD